jgi:ribonucleotide reductase alpha subunit
MNAALAKPAQCPSRFRRDPPQLNELSRRVWESRYRYVGATEFVPERSIGETWDRVAGALARVEARRRAVWSRAFRDALTDFKFLPGGRVLAGAGGATTATLANCFVSGAIDRSDDGILERLAESARTMRWGDREVVDEGGKLTTHRVQDHAFALWRNEHDGPPPSSFVTAAEIAPEDHLAMVAVLQPLVDGSISKTINVPEPMPRAEFAKIFGRAYALGAKGCTVFRPNTVTGAVLREAGCCAPEKDHR